jgi:hypothetical protein
MKLKGIILVTLLFNDYARGDVTVGLENKFERDIQN